MQLADLLLMGREFPALHGTFVQCLWLFSLEINFVSVFHMLSV